MKKLFPLCFIFLFFTTPLFAQRTEVIRIKANDVPTFITKKKYKFPTFTHAKIYLKSGEVASARINFDYFDQAVKYIGEQRDTLTLTNDDVEYISSSIDTFFYDKKFYEWIASSATTRLAMLRTYKLNDKQKIGAFGTSSPTQQIESHDAILGVTHLDLATNEEYVFAEQTSYFISKIDGHFMPATKKNISNIFPKKDIENYIASKKLNITKQEDLITLFVYANKL
jgi:hypothetical protein